jgi:hypothetical protein
MRNVLHFVTQKLICTFKKKQEIFLQIKFISKFSDYYTSREAAEFSSWYNVFDSGA